jgi:hypothetical protein
MMNMAERNQEQSAKPVFNAPPDKCPYAPLAMLSARHSGNSVPTSSQIIYAQLVGHPAGTSQTECRLRIARDRARGKRGPPVSKNLQA